MDLMCGGQPGLCLTAAILSSILPPREVPGSPPVGHMPHYHRPFFFRECVEKVLDCCG